MAQGTNSTRTAVKKTGHVATHTMVRKIGAADGVGGVVSVTTVDAELKTWFDKGYELFNTHYIGLDAGVINMMYVLVKSA